MDVTLIARDAHGRGSPDPRVFDSEQIPAAEGALADLRVTVGGADLAAPPVVLPDFHHKSNMELPSSVAVATRASVRPTLTSASVNCGMALIALNSPRPARAGIDEFYRRVRARYPYPPGMSTELSARDVLGCARDGGAFAAERFGTGSSILERVEELGRLDLDRYDGADRLQRELPGLVLQLARLRFGMVGPTNHFIELQEVEEVFDPETAAKLGVAPGQMTLQYHAGGGVFPGAVGAMFGRRKHYPKQIRAAMSVVKPLYHGRSARSLSQLKQRYRLYFAGGCPPVPLDSDEGRRLMLANAARSLPMSSAARPGNWSWTPPTTPSTRRMSVASPPWCTGTTHAARTRPNSCHRERPSPRRARRYWSRAPTGRRRTCVSRADHLTRCTPPAKGPEPWSVISPAGGSLIRTRSTAPPCDSSTTTLSRPARHISMTRAWTRYSRCWSGVGWSGPWPGCARSRYCTEEDRDCALDHSGTAVGAAGAPGSRDR